MTARIAACDCGRLRVACEGEPVRVSVCHCLKCQKRTGSAFGVQARYPKEKVTAAGPSRTWSRIADSGLKVTFSFCPSCGTTVHWHLGQFPDVTAVAVGAFADRDFPGPKYSVNERRKHACAPSSTCGPSAKLNSSRLITTLVRIPGRACRMPKLGRWSACKAHVAKRSERWKSARTN
jgi:hypothetical protein